VSRAPVKPPAKKVPTAQVVTPKRNPSKRAPKRAVAVETNAEAMAPGHVSAMAMADNLPMRGYANSHNAYANSSAVASKPKPKSSRQKMLDAQKALHAQYEKPSMREWEDTHFPRDYATENAEARRKETRDTAIYAFVVFGIIAVVCAYVFWWSWK